MPGREEAGMRTEDYRVRLDGFEGPLDLLLFLIQRAEVDIQDIPIAAIAGEYVRFLDAIDQIDIEAAGEFLVMAAMLTEIKSRMVRPVEAAAAGAASEIEAKVGEDPRAELVRTLLAYRRFRSAADALEARRRLWNERTPARVGVDHAGARAILDAERSGEAVDLGDIDLLMLAGAYRRVAEAVDFARLGGHRVVDDDTPLELHAADVLDQVRRRAGSPMSLGEVFAGRTRGEMIGLFLAVLELVRRRSIRLRASVEASGVCIEPGEEEGEPPALT